MKTLELPKWLEENASVTLPLCKNSIGRTEYLEKTLQHIEKILVEELESTAVRPSNFLYSLDPHVKLCALLALLLASALTKQLLFLAGLNFLLFLASVLAGFRIKSYAIRVGLPAFIFTGLVVLPGVLSWVTPGERLFVVYEGLSFSFGFFTLPGELYLSKQGVQSALFVTLRSAASLGLAALLIKTTCWSEITKALAGFKLPSLFVTVLDLTYRYLNLFLFLLMDFIMGRKSRLAGKEAYKDKLSWMGSCIASFLRLTKEYSMDIHYAMQVRGYTGQYYREKTVRITYQELIFLLFVALVCVNS